MAVTSVKRLADSTGDDIATYEVDGKDYQAVVPCVEAGTPMTQPLTDTQIRATALPVSLASLPALIAGTAVVGAVKDDGPNTRGTSTYATSADMSTAAAIGPAPTAGQKSVLKEIDISALVAMEFSLQEETSATVFRSFFIPASGTLHLVFRDELKLATADKRWFGKASIAGNVRIGTITKSEA
jgi:hypothetical protein